MVRGQVEVATTDGVIAAIDLDPPDPPVSPDALTAIHEADWVVLGPGSWFTSVIPHLMVLALRDALVSTNANVVVVLNLEEQEGETPGSQALPTTWQCWLSTRRSWSSIRSLPTVTGSEPTSTTFRTSCPRTAHSFGSPISPSTMVRRTTIQPSWQPPTP